MENIFEFMGINKSKKKFPIKLFLKENDNLGTENVKKEIKTTSSSFLIYSKVLIQLTIYFWTNLSVLESGDGVYMVSKLFQRLPTRQRSLQYEVVPAHMWWHLACLMCECVGSYLGVQLFTGDIWQPVEWDKHVAYIFF